MASSHELVSELPTELGNISLEYLSPRELAAYVIESDFQWKPPRRILISMLQTYPGMLNRDNVIRRILPLDYGNPDLITLLMLLNVKVDRRDLDEFNYIMWLKFQRGDQAFLQRVYNEDAQLLFDLRRFDTVFYLLSNGVQVNPKTFARQVGRIVDSAYSISLDPGVINLIRLIAARSGGKFLNVMMPAAHFGDTKISLFGLIILTNPRLALELLQIYPVRIHRIGETETIGGLVMLAIRDLDDPRPALDLLRFLAEHSLGLFKEVDSNNETAMDGAESFIPYASPEKADLFREALQIMLSANIM